MSDVREQLLAAGAQARSAGKELAVRSDRDKSAALLAAAEQIEKNEAKILAANNSDLEQGVANGLSSALLDRLRLDPGQTASGLRKSEFPSASSALSTNRARTLPVMRLHFA
jgi:glutamate-5-semialdehyde dehydrogenase